jgi:hypothetical protein
MVDDQMMFLPSEPLPPGRTGVLTAFGPGTRTLEAGFQIAHQFRPIPVEGLPHDFPTSIACWRQRVSSRPWVWGSVRPSPLLAVSSPPSWPRWYRPTETYLIALRPGRSLKEPAGSHRSACSFARSVGIAERAARRAGSGNRDRTGPFADRSTAVCRGIPAGVQGALA